MSEKPKIKSLWGELPVEEIVRTPYVILKEQASILTEATNCLLVGTVVKSNDEIKTRIDGKQYYFNFVGTLNIKVPTINNYLISILEVRYPISFYPTFVESEIVDNFSAICDSENELDIALEKVLSSQKIKRVISGLLSEVRLDKTEKIDKIPS